MDLKSWSTATSMTLSSCSARIDSMIYMEVKFHIQVVVSMNLNLHFDKLNT